MPEAVSSHARNHAPRINVTPLIDVLLVLLVIFMVISPLKPSRFKTVIGQPAPPDVRPHPLGLVVSVSRDLHLTLNEQTNLGTVENPGPLAAALEQVFRQREENGVFAGDGIDTISPADHRPSIEKTVFIKAPRTIPYGEIAKIIDAIKGAGAAPIGLQIDDLD